MLYSSNFIEFYFLVNIFLLLGHSKQFDFFNITIIIFFSIYNYTNISLIADNQF